MGKNKKIELPEKNGWYWIRMKGYNIGTPCWFSKDIDDEDDAVESSELDNRSGP